MKFVLLKESKGLDKCVFVTTKVLWHSTDGLLLYWFCHDNSPKTAIMMVPNYRGFSVSAKFFKMERLSVVRSFLFPISFVLMIKKIMFY